MSGTRTPPPGKSDIPRRPGDTSATAGRRPSESGETTADDPQSRRLIVGRDISLTGEISACDHLIVEGRIEARIGDCKTLDVADGGTFKGSADIGDADIAGRFEGDLSVQNRLTLRATGVVNGTIKYGELAVEAGGRLIGQTEPINANETVVTPLVDPGRRSQSAGSSGGSASSSSGSAGSAPSGSVSSSSSHAPQPVPAAERGSS
jgi:cytoskeletal protein CcmA (bactofilin family)